MARPGAWLYSNNQPRGLRLARPLWTCAKRGTCILAVTKSSSLLGNPLSLTLTKHSRPGLSRREDRASPAREMQWAVGHRSKLVCSWPRVDALVSSADDARVAAPGWVLHALPVAVLEARTTLRYVSMHQTRAANLAGASQTDPRVNFDNGPVWIQ